MSRGNTLFSRPQKLGDGVLNQMTVQVEEELVSHLPLCPTLSRPQAFLLSLCQEKKKHLCSALPRGHIPRTPCDFHKFSFFFFPSSHLGLWKGVSLKRSFKCFSLRQRMSALGKSLVRLLKVMGCWEPRFLRLMHQGVVDCVWRLLSCCYGDGQKDAQTPESHPPSPGQLPQCPLLTLFWARSF